MPRYTFGPFSLDPEARVLLREGEPVPMAGKTLDTLLLLVQNHGKLIDKDELLSKVWAGSVVEEANLTQAISTVRKVLADNPKEHRYIATVAGRGYQFVAPVTELTAAAPETVRKQIDLHLSWRRNRVVLLGMIAVFAAALIPITWSIQRRPVRVRAEFVERQLTFNSAANTIASAAVSPNGKYLAYSDPTGVHVRLLGTGEEWLIPMPAGLPASTLSYVDSWFPDATQLLAHSREPGEHGRIWMVSTIGQSPRELRDDARGWEVSPDGTHIAFSPGGALSGEIWVMDSQGENAQKVLGLGASESLGSVHWSPDGRRLAYISDRRADMSIESCDLRGADRTTWMVASKSEQWLEDLSWLSDGRIVYAVARCCSHNSNLWQVAVDTHSAKLVGNPKQIVHWIGSMLWGLSASADGKRLAFVKGTSRAQAYLAELVAGGMRMSSLRRLTNNEAENSPSAWTSDSRSVLFTSNRNGEWGIFKQRIDQGSAELIATGHDIYLPRLSPDGAWVLYMESWTTAAGQAPRPHLMRVSVNGGLPQPVLAPAEGGWDFHCSRLPAKVCIFLDTSEDRKHLILTAFDPLKGKGKVLRTLPLENSAEGLSPDGSTFATAKRREAQTHIRLLSVTGGSDREITLKDWPNIVGLDWSADGKGLYCGFTSPQGGTLVYVELNGATHVLWHSNEVGVNAFLGGIPSPDGHYLLIWGGVNNANVWMVEGF